MRISRGESSPEGEMPWKLFKDSPGKGFDHVGKLLRIVDVAGVPLSAKLYALATGKDISHCGDYFLDGVGAPLSANYHDGQVQPGVSIKAHTESFQGFQVVDLARNK